MVVIAASPAKPSTSTKTSGIRLLVEFAGLLKGCRVVEQA